MTGGTGFLGRRLAATLLERGHAVSLLGRNFVQVQPLLAAGATAISADLRDQRAVQAACAGMDLLYHAGALSAPWGKAADFHAINVGGTQAVVEGCRLHNVQRLIYVSSPSVVFDGHDQIQATERVPYPHHFTSVYSLTKKLGEDYVNASTVPSVIVRPKAIFGPGDQTLLPRLIAAARLGRLPQIGSGRNLVDLTYVDNVVDALLLCAENLAAIGKTYTITNDEHPALWETIRTVLTKLDISTRLRPLPLAVVLRAATLMEWRAALSGREPLLTRYSALILARTQTYDISAIQQDLGYRPRVSLAQGIEETLETLKGER